MSKEYSIDVNNIDRTPPSGSCTVDQTDSGSYIDIIANDVSGIKKYVYNNTSYTNKRITISSFINNAKITIYDNANNTKEVTCTVAPRVSINNVSKDGVIVTVKAKKVNTDIAGYYFSYTNERPNKNTGGYIATNKETIDVVRLPGTTYVWVEDSVGKISNPKTITIANDALLITTNKNYTILENTPLSTYLSPQL